MYNLLTRCLQVSAYMQHENQHTQIRIFVWMIQINDPAPFFVCVLVLVTPLIHLEDAKKKSNRTKAATATHWIRHNGLSASLHTRQPTLYLTQFRASFFSATHLPISSSLRMFAFLRLLLRTTTAAFWTYCLCGTCTDYMYSYNQSISHRASLLWIVVTLQHHYNCVRI